jgi:hypothetical protein
MSSVTRFIRQIPTGQQYYPQYTASVTALANAAYTFVADQGNYVGNYPPGYVVPLDPAASNNTTQALYDALVTAASGPQGGQQSIVLRDMGKTIFAKVADELSGLNAATNPAGYFRQVQVLIPQPISATQGFLGGTNGSTFGVVGQSMQYTPYATIYLPTNVAGVFYNPSGNLLPSPTPQGQM